MPIQKPKKHEVDGDEWMTPDYILSVARHVLGTIELDPCSTELANKRVKAKKIYTKEDDALSFPHWRAKTVWMNPPYSRMLIKKFTQRIVQEVMIRNTVDKALVLTNASTSSAWWQELAKNSRLVVFPAHRISFIHPDIPAKDQKNSNNNAQSIFYLESKASSTFVSEDTIDKLLVLGHVSL